MPPKMERWSARIAARKPKHMNFTIFARAFVRLTVLSTLTLSLGTTHAQDSERILDDAFALNGCLTAWGKHPFGSHPVFTRLATSVKISGVGPASADRSVTDHPSLILVDPLVNVQGDASLALTNPNGWYCLRAPANELGALRIQLHCRARLAAASGGATVWGSGHGAPGVTMMGPMQVERVGCDGS
jgi:hypothetical protein